MKDMSLDMKFQDFKSKHDLNDEAMAEMLSMFNDSFIDLAHKLLANNTTTNTTQNTSSARVSASVSASVSAKKNSASKKINDGTSKKWATKIAGEYASENNLTLDNFDKEKITKKDIDEYLKNNSIPKKQTPKLITDVCTEIKKPKESSTKEKCKGITKTGEPCNRPGTDKPETSKNFFCFRHAMDWKNYEVSSDSDDLEFDPPVTEKDLEN